MQSSAVRRSLHAVAAGDSSDAYSFIVDASSASSKAVTTSYLTVGEVRGLLGPNHSP